MNKLIMMIGAAGCLALEAFADTEAYTLGDTSLANGKITFVYDDSGKITELSMKPDYGETLTLTGETLTFADGAQIVGARNGEACIANAITADGVVNFGPARGNFTYSGDFLPSNIVNAVVVAANTSLEDIEIVSARYAGTGGTIRGFNKDVDYFPHHVSLSGGKLTAQMSHAAILDSGDPRTTCVKIELSQKGEDVVCRAVNAAYIDNVYDEDNDFDQQYTRQRWAMATKESVAEATAAGTTKNGYGFDTLVLRTKTAGVTFLVNGTMDVPSVAGNDVAVTFKAASATATVNVSTTNSMTDCAYIIIGDAEHKMTFNANTKGKIGSTQTNAAALPKGTTDVYGEGTILNITYGGGIGDSENPNVYSAITMHPGSKLQGSAKNIFNRKVSNVMLDAADIVTSGGTYVPPTFTMSNGSSISVTGETGLSAVYDTPAVLNVTGVGASSLTAPVTLYSNNTTKREWEICVEDMVEGDDADFEFNGDVKIPSNANQQYSVIKKTGEGTMLMNGTINYVNNATRIVEGELLLGKTGATVSGASFSLEGGTLGLAAGTANEVADVTLTASSTISVGSGATLTIAGLTVPEGSALAINGDVLGHVKVSTALDAATLSRIRINGKAAYQSGNGYFIKRGLMISFH